MSGLLAGRRILVTGPVRCIALAVSKAAIAAGAKVAMAGRVAIDIDVDAGDLN